MGGDRDRDGDQIGGAADERLVAFADQGVTEIVYQPTGPDIARELEAFINVTRALFHS